MHAVYNHAYRNRKSNRIAYETLRMYRYEDMIKSKQLL